MPTTESKARSNGKGPAAHNLSTVESTQRAPASPADTFPILFVSAPHIEDAVSGSFPGLPTPLLYATTLMSQLVREGRFPAKTRPYVTAIMNPPRYGNRFEGDLIRNVQCYRPRLVGISNMSESHYYAMQIARAVKQGNPETIVLLGGQHEDATNPLSYIRASERVRDMAPARRSKYESFVLTDDEVARICAMQTLYTAEDRRYVDFVFAGDAANFLVEFLRIIANNLELDNEALKEVISESRNSFASLSGAGTLTFFSQAARGLVNIPMSGRPLDGDELPYIDTTGLTHGNRYPVFGGKLTAQIMAASGCKYACEFCHESASQFLYGIPKIIQRSPDNVMGEIIVRHQEGFEAVFFDDSTFSQNRQWTRKLLNLLHGASGHIDLFEWGCQTTINDVDYELLVEMAAAGCSYIYFGVESIQPDAERVQKVVRITGSAGRKSWEESFGEVARWCQRVGIRVGTSLQFGLGESWDHRTRTLHMIADLHRAGAIPDGCVALNINTPYPGTLQWLDLLHKGKPMPDYRVKLDRHPGFETAHQYSEITGPEVDRIYMAAKETLRAAVHVLVDP